METDRESPNLALYLYGDVTLEKFPRDFRIVEPSIPSVGAKNQHFAHLRPASLDFFITIILYYIIIYFFIFFFIFIILLFYFYIAIYFILFYFVLFFIVFLENSRKFTNKNS